MNNKELIFIGIVILAGGFLYTNYLLSLNIWDFSNYDKLFNSANSNDSNKT